MPPAPVPGDLGGRADLARADLAVSDLKPADLRAPLSDLSSGCGVAEVVVNELQTGSAVGGTDEWVELYNPCPNAVDLTGSRLVYRSATNNTATDTYTLASLSTSLGAGAFFLVANTAFAGSADIKPFEAGAMAATGGGVGLRDPSAALADSVGWGTANNPFVESVAVGAPGNGQSIARFPNGTDSNENQLDFLITPSPTPGAAN